MAVDWIYLVVWLVVGIAVALVAGWTWLFPTFGMKGTFLAAVLIFVGGIVCASGGWWGPSGAVYALLGLALLMWGKR